MKCLGATIVVLAVIAVSSAAKLNIHPLSEENIALINQKAKTWKAGKNFEIHEWENVKRISSGALRNPNKKLIKSKPHDVNEAIPDTFDAREAWPKCESIKQIRDQSNCGSCWAFAAVEAMSDRICIASNQTKQVYVSAEDLNSCCWACGFGCEGGYIDTPWDFWQETGIVTGGLYKSKQGCKDYSLQPCEHHTNDTKFPQCSSLPNYDTPDCVQKCDDPSVSYKDSKTYGQETIILDDVQQIQLEILKNGPVETAFDVYDDFPNYKSGVYQRTSDQMMGGHAVKIIGWGTENNTPYWLIANSWNPTWGDNGYFKIIRGRDECGIEDTITAALPKM